MKNSILLFLILLLSISTHSQTRIDTLRIKLDKTTSQKKKIDILLDIGTEYTDMDSLDLALSYSLQAYEILKKRNFSNNVDYLVYATLAADYGNLDKFDEAMKFLTLALGKAETDCQECSDTYKASIYIDMATLYFNQEQWDKVIEMSNESLVYSLRIEDQEYLYNNMDNLGYAYGKKEDFNKSLEYHQKALKYSEKLDDKEYKLISLTDLAYTHRRLKNYIKAEEYLEKAKTLMNKIELEKSDKNYYLFSINRESAQLHLEQNNFQKAIEIYNYLLKANIAEDEKFDILHDLADIYFEHKEYKQALAIHQKLENFDFNDYDLIDTYLQAINIYLKQNKLASAEQEYQKFIHRLDKNEKLEKAEFMTSVAQLYLLENQTVKALDIARKAKALLENLENISNKQEEKQKIKSKKSEVQQIILIIEGKKKDEIEKLRLATEKKLALEKAERQKVIAEKSKVELDLAQKEKLRQKLKSEKLSALLAKNKALSKAQEEELARKKAEQESDFSKIKAKEAELNAKKSKLAQREAEKDKQLTQAQAQRNLIIFALVVLSLLAIALVILRSRQKQRKANNRLAEQNEEIKKQSEELLQQTEIIEQERQKSENLLLNILPLSVAQELKTTGTAQMKSYTQAYIIFTDFKGFTKIASQMPPDKLMQELNDCFTAFDEIIQKHNIEKIKTIGDAYMCAGGVPEANQTNPIDAVLAGLEMQDFIQRRRKLKLLEGEEYWQCRLGINTGEVRAGVIGTSKFAYDIWGDAVNIASRMESGGEVNKVNISEATYELVKDYFDCEYRGAITVKNGLTLKMYFVNRIKPEYSANVDSTRIKQIY